MNRSRAAEKDLEVLVDERLYMTWQCVFAAQKASSARAAAGTVSQQVRGGDSALLPCCGETPPGVLHSSRRNEPRKTVNLIVADSSVNLDIPVFVIDNFKLSSLHCGVEFPGNTYQIILSCLKQ